MASQGEYVVDRRSGLGYARAVLEEIRRRFSREDNGDEDSIELASVVFSRRDEATAIP